MAAAHSSSASSRRPRRYSSPGALAGERRCRGALLACGRAVQGEGGVPVATLVGEVGAQFGESRLGAATLGDGERCVERIRQAEPVLVLDGQQRLSRQIRIADAGTEHERVLEITAGDEGVHRIVQRLGGRRRQRPPQEGTADNRRAHVVGAAEDRFEEDPLRRQPGEVGAEVATADGVEQPRRQFGDGGGEFEQLAFRFAEFGDDVLGEIVEQHSVGRQQVLDEGAAVERATAPRCFDGEVHGERPATGGVDDVDDGRSRFLVEGELVDVGGGDGELLGPDAGDLTGRPQTGDAQVRLVAACDDEVQPWRQAVDERLQEQQQGIVVADVDVVEHDDRFGGDDRVGRGTDVCRQGGDLVATIRRIRRRVRRQHLAEIGVAVCSDAIDEGSGERERGPTACRPAPSMHASARRRGRATLPTSPTLRPLRRASTGDAAPVVRTLSGDPPERATCSRQVYFSRRPPSLPFRRCTTTACSSRSASLAS